MKKHFEIKDSLLKKTLYFWVSILIFTSCMGPKVDVYLLQDQLKQSNASTPLIFTPTSITLISGEEVQITSSNGQIPYTSTTINYGTFNSGTSMYQAPTSLGPTTHVISFQDFIGATGDLTINIMGFRERVKIDFIKSFNDQNYPMSISQTADGSLYTAAVFIDGSGWEDWGVYKSTDNGVNWTMVDRYLMYLAGESHPMQIATYGNDVYVCGYVWGYGGTPGLADSEWLVRKSSNGGTSWTNVDHFYPALGNNVCYTMAISASGEIFTAGYAESTDGYVRMSSDDGATWQTIGYFPGAGVPTDLKIAPNGDVWVFINGSIYKGIYSAGSWNWNGPYLVASGTFSWVAYQKRGELEIISDTEAYFTGKNSTWKVWKTIDGGLTWSQVFSRSSYEGVKLIQLSSGELISSGGGYVSSTRYHSLYKSIDDGVTWTETLNISGQEGTYVQELANGNIISLAYNYFEDSIRVYSSSDKGDTWSLLSKIVYMGEMYTEIDDYAEDSAGNMYASSWIGYQNPDDPREPYAVMKSSDNGASWTASDYIEESGRDLWAGEIEFSGIQNIFALNVEWGTNYDIRMTANNGITWSTVYSTTNIVKDLRAGLGGEIYFLEDDTVKKISADGTLVSSVYTFSIITGQSNNYYRTNLAITSDGSLFASLRYDNAGTQTWDLFKSVDGGASFSSVYSIASTSFYAPKVYPKDSSEIYFVLDGKINRSNDGGASWTQIYDGSSGYAGSIVFSNDGRMFTDINDNIYIYNTTSASLMKVWNVDEAITPNIDSNVSRLVNCKLSPINVCAVVVDYTKYLDAANYIWPLE